MKEINKSDEGGQNMAKMEENKRKEVNVGRTVATAVVHTY
jgi:hypothetical protein